MRSDKFNIESLKNSTVAVIGLGISNLPLIDFLNDCEAKIWACDYKTEEKLDSNALKKLKDIDVSFSLGETYLDILKEKNFDYVFRTPGIRPDKSEIVKAKENGAVVSSEIELVFELAKCPIVGITGSDGKTTTTTLVSKMLKESGFDVHLGGNIGKPLVNEVLTYEEDDIIVLELSSFQLMNMKQSPKYALITNLSPNHLDYHKSYEEYCESKFNIFKHQNSSGYLVINEDNQDSRKIKSLAKSNLFSFSMKEEVCGSYLKDNFLILNT